MPAKTVFQWSHYLALADEWITNAATSQHPEAIYRSLISRAYYAVFHASFDLAQTLGLENTQSASDHYRVRKFFENRGRVAAQLSQKLRSLYDWRVSADYSIEAGNPVTEDGQAIAKQTLLDAHKAMELIGYLQPKAKN